MRTPFSPCIPALATAATFDAPFTIDLAVLDLPEVFAFKLDLRFGITGALEASSSSSEEVAAFLGETLKPKPTGPNDNLDWRMLFDSEEAIELDDFSSGV